MNDAYTIYPKSVDRRVGEPLYTNRRGLKWMLEELFTTDPLAFHPDALMIHIDCHGSWDGTDVIIKRGHVVKEYSPILLEIQRKLVTDGLVYVAYYNHEPLFVDEEYAVLRLVKTSEFRYDRYWRFQGDSEYHMGESDGDQDDGNLNPEVLTKVFADELAALKWLLEPKLD